MEQTPSGLVVFDLDGTLTRGPTVCEVLAASLGRIEWMKWFETLTSVEDIAVARTEMAAWIQGFDLSKLVASLRDVELAPRAAEAILLLRQQGFAVAIASLTWDFAVAWFAAQLEIIHYTGTGIQDDDQIMHVWPQDKAIWTLSLADALGVPAECTAAVGDSTGDMDMLRAVGHPVFVGTQPIVDLARGTHLPGADVLTIANFLIRRIISSDLR